MARLIKKEITKAELSRIEYYKMRYRLTDSSVQISHMSNKRRVYLIATDQNDISYKIPFTYIQKAAPNPPCLRHSIDKVELFTNMSKNIFKHKDKYDYSLVNKEDINRKKKVILICKVNNHGKFKIRYDLHLYNENGCPKCGKILFKRIRTF